MLRLALLIPVTVLHGCMTAETSFDLGAPYEAPEPESTEDGETSPPQVAASDCDIEIAWMSPVDQSRYISADSELEVAFTAPIPDGVSWLFELDDTPGTSALSDDRRRATFVPLAPLAYRASYTLTADVCQSQAEHVFTVTPPPVSPEHMDELAWVIPFRDLVWLQPASAAIFLPTVEIEATIVEAYLAQRGGRQETLRMRVIAAEWDGTHAQPRPCDMPTDVGEVDLSANPLFSTEPIDLRYPIGDIELSSPDTQILGVLEDGGRHMIDLEFIGLIDVRALEEVLPDIDICAASAGLGEPCRPCPDGEIACLDAVASIAEAIPLDRPLDDQISDASDEDYCP